MSAYHPDASLDLARRHAGLSVDQLWVRYFGNGGSATAAEFRSCLADERWPAPLQHDIAASALNERFTEMDLNHPVPYWRGPAPAAEDR